MALKRRLPAQPLLSLIETRGGLMAVLGPDYAQWPEGRARAAALHRIRRDGSVTIRQADRLATEVLGCHPAELWPEWSRL